MSKDKIVGVLSHTKGSELLKKLEQAGLTPQLAQEVIESPNNHKANQIVEFLANNENPFLIPSDPMEQWVALYKKYFGIEIDISGIKNKPNMWPIYVHQGMKMQQVYDQLARLFRCWKYTNNNLDEVVTHNDRKATKSYVLWVRDRVEADEENKNKSASSLINGTHTTGITLLERLLLELHHFYTTGEHLDIINYTLSTGSRINYVNLPYMGCDNGGRVFVHWHNATFPSPSLRSRKVVSVQIV